jgi:glycosyltransferase involved in cell wall biosynthesis
MSKPHTVIIPAYRPDTRLIGLTAEVLDLGYSVIVVNDGSGDAYDSVFRALDPRVIQLRHEKNRGKGAAIKTGLSYVLEQNQKTADELDRVRLVGIMDADGQHLPADMERVLDAAEASHPCLTLGVREISGKMPLRSRFGNAVTRAVFRLLTGTRVSDTQTGLRAFSADLIPAMLRVEGERYEYEMGVLAYMAKQHVPFQEIPIATLYEDKRNSTSHFRAVRDSLRIYATLLKFAGSSFLSFLTDYGLFLLFSFLLGLSALPWLLDWGDLIANILARIISGTLNYYLNCRFVFGRKPSLKTAGQYALLAVFVLAVNSGVLYLWKLTPLPISLCKLFTEICMFLGSYTVQKKLIFKKKKH